MEEEGLVTCPEPPPPFVTIVEDGFGFVTDENSCRHIIRRYTFTNQNNLIVQVINYGATVTSIKYPDKNGILDDVVLGYDNIEGYLTSSNPYFGATVGRVANRIAKGHFKIGDEDYQLSTNNGQHHLHGGFKGFDKAIWTSEIQDKKVVMTYLSRDGEEGYPGEVLACVLFQMTTNNDFIIEMKATSSKPTPINLTNHSYFNLAGHAKGAMSLNQHIIAINADKFCHTDEDLIPTGMLKNVVNTLWDLRIGKKLGCILPHVPYGGYDQNMCIHKTSSECISFVARVYHPETGRTLEVYSNQPGVQFYTANNFPNKPSILNEIEGDRRHWEGNLGKARRLLLQAPGILSGYSKLPRRRQSCLKIEVGADGILVKRCPLCGQLIKDPDFENLTDDEICEGEDGSLEGNRIPEIIRLIGKEEAEYYKNAAFCLMTQNYPDSVHRKHFPNSILKPGENYYHIVKYKFGLFEEAVPQPDEEEIIDDIEIEGEGEIQMLEEDNQDDLLSTKMEENGR